MHVWDPLVWDVDNVAAAMSSIQRWKVTHHPDWELRMSSSIHWRSTGPMNGKKPGRILVWRVA